MASMLALFKQCNTSQRRLYDSQAEEDDCVQDCDLPIPIKSVSKEAVRTTFGSETTGGSSTFDALPELEDCFADLGDFEEVEELVGRVPSGPRTSRVEQAKDWSTRYLAEAPASWGAEKQAMVFFDWDDTLFPTTWLETKPLFASWWKNRTPVQEVLSESEWVEMKALDAAARAAVLRASQQGKVVCVTLANEQWHTRTMEAFMPLLAETWATLKIKAYYASAEEAEAEVVNGSGWVAVAQEAREQDQLRFQLRIRKKQRSMQKALRKHYGRGASYNNIISIGDGIYEQLALQEIGFKHAGAGSEQRVKTLKLREQINCSEMAAALQAVEAFLPAMVSCEDDLNIDLADCRTSAEAAAVLGYLECCTCESL